MFKKYIIAIFLIFALVAVSGCINQNSMGSGKVINESRDVSNFNQIDINGVGELIITQGDKESLIIETDDNIMPYIKTIVNANKLAIDFNNSMPLPTQSIKFYVTVKDINSITTSGSGKISSNNLKANDLTINIKGSGESNLSNLNAQTLKIIISGASRFIVSGTVNDQNIDISGAGEYNANSLTSKTATISINGAGRSTIKVSDTLNAKINGGGEILYIGNPQVNQQINGAGNIKQI
ncbi:head GIN domain-containing protein [Methanobacterium sp. ACI-7]|uniref:head GIN domain-containing protein n=1 Tax=unclassified Methanobacterium TaxID=2627676 RepID=UPI0039C3CEE0